MAVGINIHTSPFIPEESELLEEICFPDCDKPVTTTTDGNDCQSEGPDGWGLLSLSGFGETIDDVTVDAS